MTGDKEILDSLLEKVVAQITAELRGGVVAAVERQISQSLSRALLESEFHKRLSLEMQGGLQAIFKEISAATHPSESARERRGNPEELINEASNQLDAVLTSTEEATGKIMDIIEKQMSLQADSNKLLHSLQSGGVTREQLAKLRSMSDELNADLMEIMTALSFQDLTGQRIKRIIEAIRKVEGIVLDVYLTTGLKMRAREEAPDRDISEVEAEAGRKMSELKGPQAGANQDDVDSLLAQLGM